MGCARHRHSTQRSWASSSPPVSGTGCRWERSRRPCTAWRTRPSPWRPGWSTTTHPVTPTSPAPSPGTFAHEIYQVPRSWAERAYPKLIYFNELDRGNHFAAWQEPGLFSAELRAAFRSLR